MKLDLYDKANKKLDSQVEVSDDLFLAEPNEGLVHQLLLMQHTRPFRNANTKTRTEVRGGGRKPWRQKGTGRARAGSLRSPLFVGGGIMHGPRRHKISHTMPKRMRRKALASGITMQKDLLRVIDAFPTLSAPKTAEVTDFIEAFREGNQKTLVLVDQHDSETENLRLALSNLEKVKVLHWQNLNVHDLFNSEVIIMDQVTMKRIEEWLVSYKTKEVSNV